MSELYPEARIIKPMLVWKLPSGKEYMLSDICEQGEYFLEEKKDGYFYEYEKTQHNAYLFARGESKVTGTLTEKSANVPHIMSALDCLPSETIIIGEIYYPGGTSKTVTTVMGCLPELAIKRQENNLIHYYIYDTILFEGVDLINVGAEDRYNITKAIFEKYNLSQYPFLELAEKVDTDLEATISKILKRGGEGAVLKKRNYPYVPGKRPAWSSIKVKQMDSVDLVCMGFCPATEEYTGKELETWSYWKEKKGDSWELVDGLYYDKYLNNPDNYKPVTKPFFLGWNTAIKVGAYDDEGNLVEIGTVSSGLTDMVKQDLTDRPQDYLNKVVALDCMSIDRKAKTLRHPILKSWREDKSPSECKLSEIF